MKSGTRFEQGDIVLLPFPFTDLSSVKQRPVLIVSNNRYNRTTEDIITCGITSNLKDSEHSIIVDEGRLTQGGIPTTSRIKADKIFTLDQSLVRKKVAKVEQKVFDKVRSEIIALLTCKMC